MISKEAHPFRWHYGDLDDKNFQLHGHSLLLLLLLLAVLLLFVLLCIYFRRTCRYRSASADSGVSAAADGGGMEATALRKLPVRVRQGEAAACSICLSTVAEGEKERVLPSCGHGFHPECVDEWLRKQSNCPLCRANVDGPEEKVAEAPPVVVVVVA